MRIGEAAERLGVTPRTIKYYEELGLLSPERSTGRYREYDEEDLERVDRVRHMQQLGYSLAAIREVIKYRRQVDDDGCRRLALDDLESVASSLERQLEEIRTRIVRARAEVEQGELLASELAADIARCRARLDQRRAGSLAVQGTRRRGD